MHTELDHLVVLAASLAEGAAWCEATLGVAPGPGGRHPLMGTHNRLLRIDSPAFPRAYLEILAIDPEASPPARARWFGLDDPRLISSVGQGPRLWHAVLRTDHLEALRQALVDTGLDPGVPIAASRQTPEGLLSWRILVRDDGRLEAGGALPTLIQWNGPHPTAAMAASPVQLVGAELGGLPPSARAVLRPQGLRWAAAADAPVLAVTLQTPRGLVQLRT